MINYHLALDKHISRVHRQVFAASVSELCRKCLPHSCTLLYPDVCNA